MDVNVKGTFLYMKNIIPEMENSTGLIINISSGAGREEFQSWVHTAHQKFAVIGLTESAALEVNNVKIVALCPSSVDAGMFKWLFPGERQTSNRKKLLKRLLMSACIQENTVRGNPLKFIDQWTSLSLSAAESGACLHQR